MSLSLYLSASTRAVRVAQSLSDKSSVVLAGKGRKGGAKRWTRGQEQRGEGESATDTRSELRITHLGYGQGTT